MLVVMPPVVQAALVFLTLVVLPLVERADHEVAAPVLQTQVMAVEPTQPVAAVA